MEFRARVISCEKRTFKARVDVILRVTSGHRAFTCIRPQYRAIDVGECLLN
jgi:hypothetical protein